MGESLISHNSEPIRLIHLQCFLVNILILCFEIMLNLEKEQNDNVIRNSIFSLASDGQVFTADFSCRYPIDVTVIDQVSPALSNIITNR